MFQPQHLSVALEAFHDNTFNGEDIFSKMIAGSDKTVRHGALHIFHDFTSLPFFSLSLDLINNTVRLNCISIKLRLDTHLSLTSRSGPEPQTK